MPDLRARRYNTVAMSLHWLIAALLIVNILLAWYFTNQKGLAAAEPAQLHKSIGITILLLSVLRLVWRFVSPPPPLPATVSGWERAAALTVYGLFYVVMIGMPLSGWALSSASRLISVYPITLFGLVPWPAMSAFSHLPAAQMKATREQFEQIHGLLAWLAYGLILLHVGAALRHQFLKRDAVVSRMIPFVKRWA